MNEALLIDLLNRRPAMNAGLIEAYAHWNDEVYRVMGALSTTAANEPTGECPPLPEPDTRWRAQFAGHGVSFHSEDQIIRFTNERVRAAVDADRAIRAAQPAGAQQPAPSAAPTQDMIAAVLQLVDLEQGDVEDHRYDDGSKLAEQICKAVLALVPQPSPTPQADSQPAPTITDEAIDRIAESIPADSVPAPSKEEIDALVKAYLGDCGPQASRIYDFVTAILATAFRPTWAADSVLEDAARYRWLREHRSIDTHANPSVPWVVRCEFQPIPTTTTIVGEALDAAIDAARAAQEGK